MACSHKDASVADTKVMDDGTIWTYYQCNNPECGYVWMTTKTEGPDED
jgi:hypothetical protein